MVAQTGVASGFVLIFVFAVLVITVGMIGLFIKLAAAVLRGVFGGSGAGAVPSRYNVCQTRGCGCENPPAAQFCAQCGMPLQQ